jgi:hypothetical protein
MRSPSKKVAKNDAGVAALRMHVVRATIGTPRSSLLRKSVRVDRGDVGPPSQIRRWKNCATQDSSERSLVRGRYIPRYPEGAYAKCGVLQPRPDEVLCREVHSDFYFLFLQEKLKGIIISRTVRKAHPR